MSALHWHSVQQRQRVVILFVHHAAEFLHARDHNQAIHRPCQLDQSTWRNERRKKLGLCPEKLPTHDRCTLRKRCLKLAHCWCRARRSPFSTNLWSMTIILFSLTVKWIWNCLFQFNTRFERRNLKALRIYLKQPSPSWLDFSLRNITAYTKRIDYNSSSGAASGAGASSQSTRLNSAGGSSTGNNGGAAGFDAFRSKLRQNLQGVKKQTKNQNVIDEEGNEDMQAYNTAKMVGSSVHNYTEDVKKLDICPGFIWMKMKVNLTQKVRSFPGQKSDTIWKMTNMKFAAFWKVDFWVDSIFWKIFCVKGFWLIEID